MKVKVKRFQAFLEQRKMTAADLARKMDVSVSEIEKLLSGEAVGEKTAWEFILYFGIDNAQYLIDWAAIGKVNPFACEADYPPADDENDDGAGEL